MDKLRKKIKLNFEKLVSAAIESIINIAISIVSDFWIYFVFLLLILILGIWRLLWIYSLKAVDFSIDEIVDVLQDILNVLNYAIKEASEAVDDVKNAPSDIISSL